jgi:CBS domain-containing protein
MHDLELPTLRLATLRRLLADQPSPLVFARDTPLWVIEEAMWEMPRAKVVLVNPDHALCGVLVANELPIIRDHAMCADTVMITRIVYLEPEHDLETAIATLAFHHADHVVVALEGALLGVLSREELEQAQPRRRAA